MAYGVGDLISSLANPNANADLAQAITPNPNPLAQQGQPSAAATAGSPTMPNAATTKQDPYVGNLALMLIQNQQRARAAEGINQGMDRMAASFGTAQQQASKMAALHGGGGGAANPIGDVGDIMKIQQAVTDQNEHARLMANAGVFASALRDHGINVTDEQATVLMNSPKFMDTMGSAFGSNVTQTGETKNINEYGALYAKQKGYDPDPSKWTPAQAKDVAGAQANSMAGAMGGNDLETRQYLSEKQAADARGEAFPDFLAWKNQHAVDLKEQDATATNIANAKKVLPGVNTTLNNMTGIVNGVLSREDLLRGIFADKNKVRWANTIMKSDPKSNAALNAQQEGALSADEVAVIQDAQQLHNMNYRGAFSGDGGVKGIRSQVEADRVSRAADQLGNFTDPDKYLKNLNILKGTYKSAQANAGGEAQAYDQIPEDARYRLDPSYFEGGPNAPRVLPEWAKVKTVTSKSDWDQLPQGQAYKAPGSPHGSKILIKGYEQQSMDDEDNYGG